MKQNGSKRLLLKRTLFPVAAMLMISLAVMFMCPGVASAVVHVVKEGRIESVPGFRFENVVYGWDKISIDVVNMTSHNLTFGGTMIFLDRRGTPVASVRLLPAKVVHESVRRYRGHFLEGTGETARRAARVLWDFSPR